MSANVRGNGASVLPFILLRGVGIVDKCRCRCHVGEAMSLVPRVINVAPIVRGSGSSASTSRLVWDDVLHHAVVNVGQGSIGSGSGSGGEGMRVGVTLSKPRVVEQMIDGGAGALMARRQAGNRSVVESSTKVHLLRGRH